MKDITCESTSQFRRVLPASRLGLAHAALESFKASRAFEPKKSKKFSLVVVTEPQKRRILLGMKNRGFGKGMYNSFGGKMNKTESDVQCASRELLEETGLSVPVSVMKDLKVGVLHFTFEGVPDEMLVHVFRLDVTTSSDESSRYFKVDVDAIRGCDEITPQWFDDWHDIPLNNMFADDSVWLTKLLSCDELVTFEGYFHFEPGGQQVNTVRHYHISYSPKNGTFENYSQPYSLEKRLFHALHSNQIHSPSIKEFKESYAFTKAVRSFFGKDAFDVVIDVAGGHGALAALMLVTTSARDAVVIDPANVGNGSVERAWAGFFQGKILRYRHECLRTGLVDELNHVLKKTHKSRIVVVACHACQHLSDEIVCIATSSGVHVAVMPCCQKDTSPGSSWKAASKNLSIPVEKTMDLLLAGKAMSWNVGADAGVVYDVRLKRIDPKITPQNRLILCRACSDPTGDVSTVAKEAAHKKLQKAYKKAHGERDKDAKELDCPKRKDKELCLKSAAVGFTACVALTLIFRKR